MFSARMPVGGVIQRMPRPVFRQFMSDAPELSDVILKAFNGTARVPAYERSGA